MKRREFIAGLGGAAAWPLVARAQQRQMPTIGVLMGWDENDREARAYVAGLMQGLSELGWTRNIRMEVRWEASSVDRKRMLAKELVVLQPDVIVSGNTPETDALRREMMTIPMRSPAAHLPKSRASARGEKHLPALRTPYPAA